jgi:NitT/TauT family transport system substrate-binding protein
MPMARLRWSGVLVTLSLVLVAAGSARADEQKLSLAVPGIPPVFQTVHAYVADKAGFFKKYGLDVTIRPFVTGVAAARAVAAGEMDITISPTPVVISMDSNADVRLVGIYGQAHPDWLIGSTDPSLTKCPDVAGKLVGVDAVGGARAVALADMIKGCGLKIDQVQLVGLSSNVGPAMIAGQIKIGVLHLDDVPSIEAQLGHKLTIVTTMKEMSPVSHYNLFAVRADRLADRVAEIATVTGRTPQEAKAALQQYIALEFWPNGDDGMDHDAIESVIKSQKESGGIRAGRTPVAFAQLVDASLWRDALALTKAQH